MNTEKKIIERPKKENKTKLLSIRLTPEEYKFVEELKINLQFDNMRDLVLFSNDILNSLKEWHDENYKFYIMKNDNFEEIKEVEFELLPDKQK